MAPKKKSPQITFVPKSEKEKHQILMAANLRPDTIYVTSRDVAIPGGDLRKRSTAPWYERGLVEKGTRLIVERVVVSERLFGDRDLQLQPIARDALPISPSHDLYYELLPTLDEAGALTASDRLRTFPEGVTAETILDALIASGSLTLEDLHGAAGMVAEDLAARRRAVEEAPVEDASVPVPMVAPTVPMVAPTVPPAALAVAK